MLVLLTPTGSRPGGLALLAGYLSAQTWKGAARWVVVDDCDPPTPVPRVRAGIEVEVVRPAWRWLPGMNTQAACMAAGLSCIELGDSCIVLEDDDAYLPGHVANVLQALESAELAGERVARYYNVATGRCREIPGQFHASLASTAVRGRALAMLREVCAADSRRIDMDLWRGFSGTKALLNTSNVVGIKGMPGRGGIGVGHRDTFGDPDPSGQVLAEWLGAGAEAYRRYRRAGG
jgi:hypothetical protein